MLRVYGDGVQQMSRKRFSVDQAKRLKEPEQEYTRFKPAVAYLTLDGLILKQPAVENW